MGEVNLRTLKDLQKNCLHPDGSKIRAEVIRANAVKRAKHWELRRKQMIKLDGKESWNVAYFQGMRDETIEANNLTLEDLKK